MESVKNSITVPDWSLRSHLSKICCSKLFLYHAGSATGVVRGARGGRAGRPHHRAASAKTRAAAALGAAAVVGGTRRLRCLHTLRRPLQRVLGAHGRVALPSARPAARRGRLLTAHVTTRAYALTASFDPTFYLALPYDRGLFHTIWGSQ